MADYRFTLDDILDFTDGEGLSPEGESAVLRETGKQYAGDLRTTASTSGYQNGTVSTLSIGQILMGNVLFKDTATVLQKQEYLTTALLGSTLVAEDNQTGDLGGIFTNLVPNDVQTWAKVQRQQAGRTSGPASGSDAGVTGTSDTSPGALYAVEKLIAHPNFRFQGIPAQDKERALTDLREGLINPYLVATLHVLCDNFILYIFCFDVWSSRFHLSRHMAGSDHYTGDAVDIGSVAALTSPNTIDEVEGNTATVQAVLNCINSIHAPYRPVAVLCSAFPTFTSGRKGTVEGCTFDANAEHGLGGSGNGHFHIGYHSKRPAPGEIPPPPSGVGLGGTKL
jgi:hypothetical protein